MLAPPMRFEAIGARLQRSLDDIAEKCTPPYRRRIELLPRHRLGSSLGHPLREELRAFHKAHAFQHAQPPGPSIHALRWEWRYQRYRRPRINTASGIPCAV